MHWPIIELNSPPLPDNIQTWTLFRWSVRLYLKGLQPQRDDKIQIFIPVIGKITLSGLHPSLLYISFFHIYELNVFILPHSVFTASLGQAAHFTPGLKQGFSRDCVLLGLLFDCVNIMTNYVWLLNAIPHLPRYNNAYFMHECKTKFMFPADQ